MSVLQTQFQTSNVRHPRQAQFAGVSDAVELEHDAFGIGYSLSFGNRWRIGRKCSGDFADCDAGDFGRARGGLAQQVLELGEDLSIGFRSGE